MKTEEKLIKLSSVLELVQVSKSKLYDMVRAAEFPSPIKIGGNALWIFSEIENWIENEKSKNRNTTAA